MKFLIFISLAVVAFGMDVKLISKETKEKTYDYTLGVYDTSASANNDEEETKIIKKAKEFVINDQGTVFMSSLNLSNSGQLYNKVQSTISELEVTPMKPKIVSYARNGDTYRAKVTVSVDVYEMAFIKKRIKEQIQTMQLNPKAINQGKKEFVDDRHHGDWYNKDCGGNPISITYDRYNKPCEILYPKDERGRQCVAYYGECGQATFSHGLLIEYYRKDYLLPDKQRSFFGIKYTLHQKTKEEYEAIFDKDKELQAYRKAEGKTHRPNPYGIPPEIYDEDNQPKLGDEN